MARWRLGVVAAAVACALAGSPAHAEPGRADATFGVGGRARAVLGNTDTAAGVVHLADGRIVVAGTSIGQVGDSSNAASRFVLLRYLPNGTPDPTFGEAGVVRTAFGQYAAASALLALRDGKLLVVGSAFAHWSQAEVRGVAMARYLPDGRLDDSFGDRGRVLWATPGEYGFGWSAAVAPDGRIVVAGESVRKYGSAFVARFLADGRPDRTFGRGGLVVPRFAGATDSEAARGVVVLPDGSVVVAGHTVRNGSAPFLVRLTRDGRLDRSFGTVGVPGVNGMFFGLTRTPDGGFVAVGDASVPGQARSTAAVVRFRRDGRLDTAFGRRGVVSPDFGGHAAALAAVAGRDGRILVVGNAQRATYDVVLMRLTAAGRPDASFGTGGVTFADSGLEESAGRVSVARDGAIVTAGSAWLPGRHGTDHIVTSRFGG